MTTTNPQHNDPWPGLPRLADPVADRELPSVDDPSAHALLKSIVTEAVDTDSSDTNRRRPGALIAAVAAAAVLAFAAVIAFDDDGASAAPLYAAIDRTAELDSGQIEMLDSRTIDGVTAVDAVTVRFRGEDEEIVARPDPAKPLADVELSADAFTPELIEVRTIDGQTYMRITSDETHGMWEPATHEGPGPHVAFAEKLRQIIEDAEKLETCDSDPGVTAYCLSTSSLTDVQKFMSQVDAFEAARVRVGIDDETGLLTSFHVEVSNADLIEPEGRPDYPIYDVVETLWYFQPLDPDWRPEVPEVSDALDDLIHPRAAEAEVCLAMEETAEIESCLNDLGLELVDEED